MQWQLSVIKKKHTIKFIRNTTDLCTNEEMCFLNLKTVCQIPGCDMFVMRFPSQVYITPQG